ALRLKESLGELEIIALSVGAAFNSDVMKRALAVGADDLVLVQDEFLDTWDAQPIAAALALAIQHLGSADVIICGRQASDWDNALVPLTLADTLGMPCLTLARRLTVQGRRIEVERVLPEGIQTMSAALPAVVTVTNELGMLRYPTVRAKLAAARRQPQQLRLADLGPIPAHLPLLEVVELAVPVVGRSCEFIEAADGAAGGARLAEVLMEAGVLPQFKIQNSKFKTEPPPWHLPLPLVEGRGEG
ncbi:MAG: hypothetical protein KGJ86_22405, partial [Chloroflexota bacterium]|nr:hypothetical protein [Chloroflexota bacterium]